MRTLCCALLALAACDRAEGPPGEVARETPVLSVHPLEAGEQILVDGRLGDATWKRIRPLTVALEGDGVTEVALKAACDDEHLYLLALWPDETASMNRYWEYVGRAKWKRHAGEDAFSICWAPGSVNREFREQGCTMFCHGDRHAYPGKAGPHADFWYWGAQTTNRKTTLRDMWMPFGAGHRLRGDSQPEGSDNVYNRSEEYEGPWGAPRRVGPRRSPLFLDYSNTQRLPLENLKEKLGVEQNLGWKIALDLQRPILGSRGDVRARGRHLNTKWLLEMSRKRTTGNADDQPLADAGVPVYFSVAVHDGTEKEAHTISRPIELRFVTKR